MARFSPFIVAFCILMFQPVQTDLAPAIVAVSTGEGIQFYAYTTSREFQLAGSLPPNFAIRSDAQADWLIPSPQSFAVSPEGEHIAFTALSGNEAALFINTVGQSNVEQISVPSTMHYCGHRTARLSCWPHEHLAYPGYLANPRLLCRSMNLYQTDSFRLLAQTGLVEISGGQPTAARLSTQA